MKIAHVTVYPPKNEKHVKDSGVASYAKNLISRMSGHELVVVTNKLGDTTEEYVDNEVKVLRVFDRSVRFLGQVHAALKKEQPDVVHMQQELALFGGPVTAFLQQWLVFLWRRKMVVTLHGVVDLRKIDAQFVRDNSYSVPVWAVKLAMRLIYAPMVRWAKAIIVHEQHFKNILVRQYGGRADKIAVIPHGIETFHTLNKDEARTTLGVPSDARVVLYMGYATGYKGIDLLIEGFAEFARNNPKAYLILGAGEHPRVKDTPEYRQRYEAWKAKAQTLIPAKQCRWEGFIAEEAISQFYSATDVAVFPYTAALASSGPMSIAIGHEKPFLASSAFAQIFDERILFKRNPEAMARKLAEFFEDQHRFEKFVHALHMERAWAPVADQTMNLYSRVYNEEDDEVEERITTW